VSTESPPNVKIQISQRILEQNPKKLKALLLAYICLINAKTPEQTNLMQVYLNIGCDRGTVTIVPIT
jgi:uncharacterized protein affecting Mg2+/Co2+ transport